MKKSCLLIASSLALLSACSTDSLVDTAAEESVRNVQIGFSVHQSNMTRAPQSLQSTKHYNFGVFGYKSNDAVHDIMANYLVGYKGDKVGYYMEVSDQTTLGDENSQANGKSPWQYERMGYQEYIYTGGEGYYIKDQTKFMSNVDYQYLRYWDLSAPSTTFYAYSPYINGNNSVTFDNATKVMTLPNNAMVAGYDNPTEQEFLFAATQVASADYGKDVQLSFKHANAKVNIKFWEDIDGYSIRVIDLGGTTNIHGVQAAPAVRIGDAAPYTYSKTDAVYYTKQGFSVDFTNPASPSLAWSENGTTTQEPLVFEVPADEFIGTTRQLASASATTYYAIPKNNNTGFTFHVSYEMTSTTGERLYVHNATVHVPADKVNWEMNKAYTYYFKITRGSNGSTEEPGEIDPTDPDVPDQPALFPIIFDNCYVEDYITSESDHNVTDDTHLLNYSVSLSATSVKLNTVTADAPGKITPSLLLNGTAVDAPAGQWSITYPEGMTAEDPALVAYDATAKQIIVKAGAKTGIYTIVYTPAEVDKAPNTSYSATFTVIGNKTIEVSTAEIGTGGMDATSLTVTVKDGETEITPAAGTLSIVYPAEVTEDQKTRVQISGNTVTVNNNAIGGTYAVKYTSEEGSVQATFVVKQYTFTLSTSEINHDNTDQTITITTSGDGTLNLDGTPAGITLADNTITVSKVTAAGTYIVYYEVNNNGSKTKYKRTFTVKNVYVLSLNRTNVNVNGTEADRTVSITASKNSVAETGVSNIKILSPTSGEVTVTSLDYVVPANAQVGTYKVMYYDGQTIVKSADFIVKNL